MTLDHIREHCLKKKFVTEDFPFDKETLVFKVMGKMFLLTNLNPPLNINIKCEPENAAELRERYSAVNPGYHMNKKHWNTVDIDGTISPNLVFEWIDDSYNLVVKSLPKSKREKIGK
jgi:predicted DNA-binding protein (MmcQ/YjbR family)